MSKAEEEKQWGPWLRVDIPKRQSNPSQWSSGGYSQLDRGAAAGSQRVGYQSKKRSSRDNEKPKSYGNFHASNGSEESVYWHNGGENMEQNNEVNITAHNGDTQESNVQKSREALNASHANLQLCEEVEARKTPSTRDGDSRGRKELVTRLSGRTHMQKFQPAW